MEGGGTSEAKENVKEKLINFMESEVETLHVPTTSPYIYKVSKELRQGHAKVFEPISISIGPLHHDDKSPAQEFKKWYLKNFVDRLKDAGVDKYKLAEVMSSLEPHIRQCYRDIDEQLARDKLVQIMLLDGCFIMDLLLSQESKDSNDSLVGRSEKVSVHTLQQDLLKIENQIPFFVLETLSDLTWTNQVRIFEQLCLLFSLIFCVSHEEDSHFNHIGVLGESSEKKLSYEGYILVKSEILVGIRFGQIL
ncbi:UNVERIFIED_CONTAM: hypothetical protein Sindi_2842600 [Sesamum indicum]